MYGKKGFIGRVFLKDFSVKYLSWLTKISTLFDYRDQSQIRLTFIFNSHTSISFEIDSIFAKSFISRSNIYVVVFFLD